MNSGLVKTTVRYLCEQVNLFNPCRVMRKVENVFIANRGEIALRTACACRELGLRAPQAYSEAGRDSLAVRLADKAICIGPGSSQEGDSKQAALIEEQMWAGHPTQQML